MMPPRVDPPPPAVPSGAEPFRGLDATVVDFWRYAAGDLRSNTLRGVLAEWLVARALGVLAPMPDWHDHDVLTPAGVRVEVKASAFLQSWAQAERTRVVFTGLRRRTWVPVAGRSREATFNADVDVLCLQAAQEHDAYDPLDVGQWEFHVLDRATVVGRGQGSLGLATVRTLAAPVGYDALAAAVEAAAGRGVPG
ncbi:hypothetical protein [Nocardioides sp.]|uniref:hypothetical protein n=1 Tax=Nocardioides sp. TaxID=35761 RepID=UPI0035117A1C